MKKQKSWFEYYKGHDSVKLSNVLLHWPYLFSLSKNKPNKILEIGCGPADHSVFLSRIFPSLKIALLDNDQDIINWLQQKYHNRFTTYLCDITNKKSVNNLGLKNDAFDIVYSQGLMEHFDEKEFTDIVLHFLPFAKKTIFSVPSDEYPNRDFGNELLRTQKQLEDILAKIPGIQSKVSKYFPDISFRTKLIKISKHKLNIIESIRYLIFGSNHYLVEITRKD